MTSTQWPNPFDCPELTPHQQQVAATALSGRVGVLAGTPGCGKTFAAAAIIRRLVAMFGESCIAICAPTGKAAVRCNASLRSNGVEGISATTIHRLLAIDRAGYDGQGWTFQFNERNPLPQRFVITDEISMLDTDLAASLLKALGPQSHWLGIGDPYQLPPVGAGAVLRDMISSGRVPYGELTEIRRNCGMIVRGCCFIREGRYFNPPTKIDLATGDNWRHFETSSPAQTIAQLRTTLTSLPTRFDRVWDVQVLVAVNEKSPLGRKDVNVMLQELLNPHGQRVDKVRFRVDDKVICTSNTMLPIVKNGEAGDNAEKEFVANGELGKVLAVDPKKMTVEFTSPPRRCIVPLSKAKEGDSDGESSGGSVGNFDLGYAITTHKAQGSQAPIVITLIDDYGGACRVVSREWNLTAISRAESLCVTIGKWSVFQQQCKRIVLRDRKTFLVEQLRGLIPAASPPQAKAVTA